MVGIPNLRRRILPEMQLQLRGSNGQGSGRRIRPPKKVVRIIMHKMAPTSFQMLALWLSLTLTSLVQAIPVVQTTSGRVYGKTASNTTNAYLGIPYAQPPVGPLRFLAPRPLITPFSTRNATAFGLSCLQLGGDSSHAGEDCLTVNVWTPSSPSPRLKPVLVWVYGGGWNVGESSSLCTCPHLYIVYS